MANVSNTNSTTASTAAVGELADVTSEAIVKKSETICEGFSLMKRNEEHAAAERSTDREKVIEVDGKADLANYKADKNAEELKAIISLLDANTKEIVMLHRNDATREVELKYLKRILNVMIAVVAYMLWWIGHA